MAAGKASQTTPEQITHVFLLFYTNCAHAILVPVMIYWCVLIVFRRFLFPCSSACDTSLAKCMEDEVVLSLLDKISSSEILRKKSSEAIRQPAESQQNVEQNDTESGNARDRETDTPSDNNNERLMVADEHQPEHSSLGTNVSCQSKGVSGLVVDEDQLTANPLVTKDHQGAASESLSQEKLQMFDPSSLTTSDDFTFETHKVIIQYLKTHFRSSLIKTCKTPCIRHTWFHAP